MTNSTMINSFIADAVAQMSEKNNLNGLVAAEVLRQVHGQTANQIALTYLQLQKERKDAKREQETAGTSPQLLANPEYILTFVQAVMNQVCWNARRLFIANSAEEYANGIDFSQDVAELVGVSVENPHITEIVDDDFMTLNNLHSWLGGQMSYLNDIQPLFHFSQSENIDGEWVTTTQCTSFDDAFTAMQEIVERLNNEADDKVVAEAHGLDFSAKAA